ncbi:hypothetical protein [Salicibibacter kimchii]|uniref:hypothetical protein n=1 Tax=Salicibibacter kimchii TaxID=2099786 RepID=UPI001356A482|nr:hypothetical protein [Salicibibacter kimchii]
MQAPIRMTKSNLKEAYAAILEKEKAGYEQVGHIGSYTDMNGQIHYVIKMRKGEVASGN